MAVVGSPQEQPRDAEGEVIGKLLLVGVITAAVLVAAGLLAAIIGLAPGSSLRLTSAGLIILIFTPIARVLAGLVVYVRERDPVFAFISFLVLAVLVAGVFLGRAH